jgi:glycoprotein endo-alpha-1,2-mannosidase
MRRLLSSVILALLVPATAQAGVHTSAFYYPWYGTSARDGAFQHWSQRGHTPPNDIASAYYPLRGLYSSSDSLVLSQQMDEIEAAGIDELAVSWWGQGSPEDLRLPEVVAAARADGLSVAVHLEPYAGRTVASTVADLAYLRGYGIHTFYVYRPLNPPVAA